MIIGAGAGAGAAAAGDGTFFPEPEAKCFPGSGADQKCHGSASLLLSLLVLILIQVRLPTSNYFGEEFTGREKFTVRSVRNQTCINLSPASSDASKTILEFWEQMEVTQFPKNLLIWVGDDTQW